MSRIKIISLIVCTMVLGILAAHATSVKWSEFLNTIALNILSIIVASIIAAVGIFLSGIGNMFTIVQNVLLNPTLPVEFKKKFQSIPANIDNIIREIKENTKFLLMLSGFYFLATVARSIDIPVLVWPIKSAYFTKEIVINGLLLASIQLTAWLAYDTIMAMFDTYRHFVVIIKGHDSNLNGS